MSATVLDLGTLDGDVLAFGGVVSNAHALTTLSQRARDLGIAQHCMVSTGDIVAYCAQPAEAVSAMRALGAPSIRGNCEINLGAGADDCGCGFETGSLCDVLSGAWYAHAQRAMDTNAREWMAGLPDFAIFRAHDRRWGVVHGGATEVSRFLWPTSPDTAFVEEFRALEAITGPVDAILAGHCGIPFIRHIGDRLWFNTGALGMPANDGSTNTSFGVISQEGPRIERLEYDHGAAAAAMRAVGLTQGYDRCLETGYWPSEDILPSDLRRQAPTHLDSTRPAQCVPA